MFMENRTLSSLLGEGRFTTPVVEKSPPPTECIPFQIPLGIIEIIRNDCYDGTVNPSIHLLKLTELCELFKISGLTRDGVMRKLFALSLKGKALEWYRILDDSHLLDWEEIQSLFYSKFYPLHEVHENRNYVYNFYPHDGESIAQAWGRLKTLMLKCPNHGLPKDMIITNFYARLSRQDKDLLDASSMGSFTNKKIDAKWELLERIQRNTEDWEIDKGKESGIIYEYDCIKSFVETTSFNKFSAKFGLDSQLLVDFLKSFASHLNMPKEDWIKYHKPFKETCKENEIVHDDCNMHDPIPKNEVLYKHVNFCGVDRPCERPMIEEEKYCKQHKHERTITWVRDLNEIARELCDLYPFTCELCRIEGHFNFQCMNFQNITVNRLCDNMITSDLYDELMLFLMCEELSEKTSWLDVNAIGIKNTLQNCHLYCVVNCHKNDYISKIRKEGTLPKYKNVSYISANKKESFSQVSPIVSNDKPGYVEKLHLQPLPPKVKKKKKKRRRKRSEKEEEWVSTWHEHIPPINFYPNDCKFKEEGEVYCLNYHLDDTSVGTIEDDFDYDMHVTYCDWENDDNATYDLENLFGTNSESDDMESSKLGDDRIANPLPTSDVIIDNSFASKNKDNMFTNIVASNDNALLYHDDVITPIYSDYKGTYDIRRNYPYETCHNHGGNYSLVEHHLPNTQLIYSVQVVYDSPTPTITNEKDYAYVESKSTFLHVDHGNNALCDAYIVEFIRDPTENYYEKGTYAYRYFNNIKFPLFMLKVLKLHLFCLPMLIALCFNELFYCNIPMHRKHVRLKCVWYLLLDALFCSSTLIPTRASLKS